MKWNHFFYVLVEYLYSLTKCALQIIALFENKQTKWMNEKKIDEDDDLKENWINA